MTTNDTMEIESAGAIVTPEGSIFGATCASWRGRTRAELGIERANDTSNIMNRRASHGDAATIVSGAGHQPFLWHPGILAKFVHARHLAGAGGIVVHLVVDHDIFDPSLVRVPVQRTIEASTLDTVTHRFAPLVPGMANAAAMALPAFSPRRYEGPAPALPSVGAGLERARAMLADARSGAVNAPMQVASALSSLMERWVGPTHIVADSALLATTLGRAFIDAMRRDPRRCTESFNHALAVDPRAARALHMGDDPELPLWRLGTQGRRERVTASQLAAATAVSQWLPRAFLLSAFMRLGVCDRFVHGTGARRYERVTEAWMRAWLGVELPPIDIASATLRLPLLPEQALGAPPITAEMRRRAWWNPEQLEAATRGDHDVQVGPAKRAMLDAIAAMPRRSPQRRAGYRAMLDRLAALRNAHAGEFAEIDTRLAADRARIDAMQLAHDRTWPFIYFDDASLDAAFGVAAPTSGAAASGSGR